MSSYVDEDTARAIDAGRETALDALASVQYEAKKVFAVFVAVFLGMVIALRVAIWDWLKGITESQMAANVRGDYEIIAVTPFDVILMQIKVGLIVGAVAGGIFALYLARKNILARLEEEIEVTAPRLYTFAALIALLAIGGMAYAYGVFFPLMFKVLAEQAYAAGVKPSYDIVAFTQFLLLLTLSFGMAAQLPLLMGLLSYTEIVPYETFRDKWRYAVLGIFVFGAVFSPPDPFTQILWAIPLIALYAFSLGVAKVVTNVHRASAEHSPVEAALFRRKAYQIVGAAALTFLGTFLAYATGTAVPIAEAVLEPVPASVDVPAYGEVALPATVGLGGPGHWLVVAAELTLVVGGVVLAYHLVDILRMPVVHRQYAPGAGDPEELDLTELDADALQAAPPEPFAALSEDEAVELAGDAMEAGREEWGKTLLQRWEEVDRQVAEAQAEAIEDVRELDVASVDVETVRDAPLSAFADLTEEEAIDLAGEAMEAGNDETGTAVLQRWEEADETDFEADAADDEGGDDVWEEGLLAGTTAGVLDAFTAEERDEDELGGYLYDIGFVLDSLRSRMFVVFGTFMSVFIGSFAYLYTRGIEDVVGVLLSRIPHEQFPAEGGPEALDVLIARHPVEVLIFIVKFSGVLAIIVTLPLLLYYAWPALQERRIAPGSGDRRGFLVWGGLVIGTTLLGSAAGFFVVAPAVINYLVVDAVASGMVISYRIKSFLWVIFYMTIGLGLLGNVPMGMLTLHYMDLVRFPTFRKWWRQVVLGIFVGAMFLTPSGVLTMVLFAIPITVAYLVGLGALWLLVAPATLASEVAERLPTVRR